MEGVIKTIVDGKGFGFIKVEGKKDVFFHAKNLINANFDDLRAGDKVVFGTEEGDKGTYAVEVEVV